MPVSIFCCYSHKDEEFRDELEKHLSILHRAHANGGWHDRRVGPGQDWRGQIDPHLYSAQIILPLISADFLASDYCSDREMKLALERDARGLAVLIPVILRPVDWAGAPFAHLKVLPSDGKPVTSWPDRDEAFAEIAFAISDIAMRFEPATPQAGVQQNKILTPGLVQMVTVLQLNRLELKDMVRNEIEKNPVFQEPAKGAKELTPAHEQLLLERKRQTGPADQASEEQVELPPPHSNFSSGEGSRNQDGLGTPSSRTDEPFKSEADPFEDVDFAGFFDLHAALKRKVSELLDSASGLRDSGEGACQLEPDVFVDKNGDDYIVTLNENDIPQLRVNADYKQMFDREQELSKDLRSYIEEHYSSALQLIEHIEQRRQTILTVCRSIFRRQREFLEHGVDHLKPMMINEIAEEIGAHPSTVARVVANKCAHTPQGVFQLKYFFSGAVRGQSDVKFS